MSREQSNVLNVNIDNFELDTWFCDGAVFEDGNLSYLEVWEPVGRSSVKSDFELTISPRRLSTMYVDSTGITFYFNGSTPPVRLDWSDTCDATCRRAIIGYFRIKMVTNRIVAIRSYK